MSRNYPPYKTVLNGGFGITDILPKTRKPLIVEKISANEVYAIYADIDSDRIQYKQSIKADGSGSIRKNIREKIEKSADGGKTWKEIYCDDGYDDEVVTD